jgi:16S rRNA (guanine527-N7)-methyltransferase
MSGAPAKGDLQPEAAAPMAEHQYNFSAADLAADQARAFDLVPVSRETRARLERFVEFLLPRAQLTNLIARSTFPTIWTRHVADSLQLLALAPNAKCWVDLGSGAGFPGLVIACALADRAGATVHLVESTGKKAAFLCEAASHIGVPVEVHAVRIEDFVKNFVVRADVVCARALAPLDELLKLAYPLLKTGAQGLFLKGQDVDAELTKASKYWNIDADLVPSKTDPRGRIVVVRSVQRRPQKP